MNIVAATYPGQSEDVRVARGRRVWVMREGDEFPRSELLTWRDVYPQQTHSPREFLAEYPPKPGGMIERAARETGLL